MKICPICKSQFPTKQALATHMATAHVGGRPQRRNKIQTTTASTMVLYRRELWGGTISGATECEIYPGASKLPTLDSIAMNYEEFKIVQWSVSVVPNVGSNTNGSYTCGYSYAAGNRPTNAVGIAGLSPSTSKPVYASSTLSVNARRLMGTAWLPTSGTSGAKSPGAFIIIADKSPMLWVTYKVIFNGPTAVKRSNFDDIYRYDARNKRWVDEQGKQVERISYDEPVNMQLDVGASAQTTLDQVEAAFAQAFTNLSRIHSMWNQLVGFTHYIGQFLVGTLPIIAVPAIMHVQRRPFRPILLELFELGYNPSPREDPGARGGKYLPPPKERDPLRSFSDLEISDQEP